MTRWRLPRALVCCVVALGALLPTTWASAAQFAPRPTEHRPQGDLTKRQELEAFMDEVIGQQMALDRLPGATIAIVKDGQLLFAKGYGYADVATQMPVQAATTVFRSGSVSKLFTWTAVMQLVEQGKLDMNTDVNTYLRHFQIPKTFDQPITLQNLLTHTAGFEERELNGTTVVQDVAALKPLAEALAQAMPARVRAPGQLVSYCNYCAALAGEIVADVSAEPFEQYIADHIFKPLGMNRSTFAQSLSPELARNRAVGYQIDANGMTQAVQDPYVPLGPAGIMSTTATDMARFMIAQLEGGRYDQAQILQPATLKAMHQQRYAFDQRLPGITWGFFEGQRNGVRTLWHGGNIAGFGSWLTLLPQQRVGIYIGFNAKSREYARLAVINAFIDRFYPAPAPQAIQPPADFARRAARFTGSFRTTRRSEMTVQKLLAYFTPSNRVVANADGTLSVEGPGAGLAERDGTPKRWVETEPLLFQEVGGQATLAFRADTAGQITALLVSSFPFVAYERQAWYDQGSVQLGGLALAMLMLLGTGSAWLVAAIIRRIRRRRAARTPLEQRAQRLAIMVMVVNLLLVISVALWLPTDEIVYGLPPAFYATLVLGALSGLGAAGMAITTVLVWRRRAWQLGGRLNYTLLTLAALGIVAFLQYARLLGLHV